MSLDPNQLQTTNADTSDSVPPASADQTNGDKDIVQQKTVEFPPKSNPVHSRGGAGPRPGAADQTNGDKDIVQQKTVEFPPKSNPVHSRGGAGPRPGGLPAHYVHVITHPSAKTFEVEGSKAGWNRVFAQIYVYAIIMVVLGLIISQRINAILGDIARIIDGFPGLSAFTISTSNGAALLNIVYVPVFFFVGVLIQYAFARAFYGEGTYLAQAYCSLLYQVPLGILGGLFTLLFLSIPGAGLVLAACAAVALFVYAVVLNIFMIMGVHRLSRGKAAAVVLIPYWVTLVLALIFLAIGYSYIASHLHFH